MAAILVSLILVLLLIFSPIIRTKSHVIINGSCTCMSLQVEGPMVISQKASYYDNKKIVVPAISLVSMGTELNFIAINDSNIIIRKSIPDSADHLAFLNFRTAEQISILMPNNSEICIYQGTSYHYDSNLLTLVPEIPKYFDVGFLFHSETQNPIWVIGDTIANSDINIHPSFNGFGLKWGYKDNFLDESNARFETELIEGIYFHQGDWPLIFPPLYARLGRYTFRMSNDWNSKFLLDVYPKLEIVLPDSISTKYELAANKFEFENFKGTVTIDGSNKTEYTSCQILLNASGKVRLQIKESKLYISLGCNTSSFKINGKHVTTSWLKDYSEQNPVLTNILIALFSALFIGILATKVNMIWKWKNQRNKQRITKNIGHLADNAKNEDDSNKST